LSAVARSAQTCTFVVSRWNAAPQQRLGLRVAIPEHEQLGEGVLGAGLELGTAATSALSGTCTAGFFSMPASARRYEVDRFVVVLVARQQARQVAVRFRTEVVDRGRLPP
jgi:hypothetical protein